MKMAGSSGVKRQSDTAVFLVGQPCDDIPKKTLPLIREVLQYLNFRKKHPNLKGSALTGSDLSDQIPISDHYGQIVR